MKGLSPLFLGILGLFVFSWAGLAWIPNGQIGHLEPQTDEEGTDIFPMPRSGMAERGRKIYVANGCVYCHSQQVRADYAASDIERKWGTRRSAPRDYIFDRPVLLGKMRMGPDLANVGKRQPKEEPPSAAVSPSPAAAATSPAAPAPAAGAPAPATTAPAPVAGASPAAAAAAETAPAEEKLLAPDGSPLPYTVAWHHRHLYDPRSIARDSNMPSFRFLYEERRIGGEPAADALNFVGADRDRPRSGWEVVPSYDARCLVAYLMSLDQAHELKEVKSASAAAPPSAAAAKGAK